MMNLLGRKILALSLALSLLGAHAGLPGAAFANRIVAPRVGAQASSLHAGFAPQTLGLPALSGLSLGSQTPALALPAVSHGVQTQPLLAAPFQTNAAASAQTAAAASAALALPAAHAPILGASSANVGSTERTSAAPSAARAASSPSSTETEASAIGTQAQAKPETGIKASLLGLTALAQNARPSALAQNLNGFYDQLRAGDGRMLAGAGVNYPGGSSSFSEDPKGGITRPEFAEGIPAKYAAKLTAAFEENVAKLSDYLHTTFGLHRKLLGQTHLKVTAHETVSPGAAAVVRQVRFEISIFPNRFTAASIGSFKAQVDLRGGELLLGSPKLEKQAADGPDFTEFWPYDIAVQNDGGSIILNGQISRNHQNTWTIRYDGAKNSLTKGIFFLTLTKMPSGPGETRTMRTEELADLKTSLERILREKVSDAKAATHNELLARIDDFVAASTIYNELIARIDAYLAAMKNPPELELHGDAGKAPAAGAPVGAVSPIYTQKQKDALTAHLKTKKFKNPAVRLYADVPARLVGGPNVLSVQAELPTRAKTKLSPFLLIQQLHEAMEKAQKTRALKWLGDYAWEITIPGMPVYRNRIPHPGTALTPEAARKALKVLKGGAVTVYRHGTGVPPFEGALRVESLAANDKQMLSLLGEMGWVLYDRSNARLLGFRKSRLPSAEDYYLVWEGAVAQRLRAPAKP